MKNVVLVKPNPLDLCLSKIGMNRSEFGKVHGFGKAYLIRLSQGRHARISERCEASLFDEALLRGVDLAEAIHDEYGVESLEQAWHVWVSRHREAQTIPNPVKDASLSPFQRLVTAAGGTAGFAALLAVPDPLVERYVKGKTITMPDPIYEALIEMGYPHVLQLQEAQEKWVK